MTLIEKLINHAPEAIKKRFPIHSTSFVDFTTKSGKVIKVESGIRGEILGRMPEEGHMGFLTFSTDYSAETPEGRPIKFVEIHKARLGNTRDDPTKQEIIQSFVTAESRASTVKRIKGKGSTIIRPSALNDEARNIMWSYAEENHIKPFSKAKTLFAKKE